MVAQSIGGLPTLPSPLLPMMQLSGSQFIGDSVYPPAANFPLTTEVFRDSGFRHDTSGFPEVFGVVLPGRYLLDLEIGASDASFDLYIEISFDGGASFTSLCRRTPLYSSGVAFQIGYSDKLLLKGTERIILRIYCDSTGGSRTINMVVTLTQLSLARSTTNDSKKLPALRIVGSTSVPNTTTTGPLAFTSEIWHDLGYDFTPDVNTAVFIRSIGRYKITLLAAMTTNSSITQFHVRVNGTVVKYHSFIGHNVGGDFWISSYTLSLVLLPGDKLEFYFYHNNGSTRTVTHTVTILKMT